MSGGSRDLAPRSADAVNTGGSLATELAMHARTRVEHFFRFLYGLQVLCRRVQVVNPAVVVAPKDVFEVKATDQIDVGYRSDNVEHYAFDATDANVIHKSASACGRTDAAHFCNLGLKPQPFGKLNAVAQADRIAFDYAEFVKRIAGDTRQLPQQINIGPDRIIDVLHGKLAATFLSSGTPAVSEANIGVYLDAATKAMTEYRTAKVQQGKHGIAACVDVYLAVYAGQKQSIFATLYGNVTADCCAVRELDPSHYLA